YLGIAASLACGLIGIREGLRPSRAYRGEAYDAEEAVPRDLGAALDLLDSATELHALLGREFAQVYSLVKRAEFEGRMGTLLR
ncbi:MAG: glutamine synthetase, partial [Myxococcota bacterium]